MRLYLPCSEKEFDEVCDQVCRQFDLCASRIEFVPVCMERDITKANLMARDELITGQADLAIPVSVRSWGNMHRLLEAAHQSGKEIVNDFRATESKRARHFAYRIDPCILNPDIDDVGYLYLVHWTRTSNSAWPGERLIDFYRDIISSPVYPRGAFATLRRILKAQKVYASPRHMPGNTPTVAFTARPPREVVPLMKWRARYTEMTFEPYGFGIRKRLADEMSLRPVHYYTGRKELGERAEPWLWQSNGTKTDWQQEDEYRHLGDLDFSRVDVADVIAFTRFPEEARAIAQEFNIRTVSMTVGHDSSQLL